MIIVVDFVWMSETIVIDVRYVNDVGFWREELIMSMIHIFELDDFKDNYIWRAVNRNDKIIISDDPNAKYEDNQLNKNDCKYTNRHTYEWNCTIK